MSITSKKEYRVRNKPTAQRYLVALLKIGLRERDKQLLEAQYYAPSHTVTAPQLAQLASISGGYSVVNLAYGKLGHRLSDAFDLTPDLGEDYKGSRWWSIISVGYSTNQGFLWQMHPEMAKSLEQLEWVKPIEIAIPEEVDTSNKLVEGAVRHIQVNAYERNAVARRQCIDHHGCRCSICGFDFKNQYGDAGSGFIHVHHLCRISDVSEKYVVNPVEDLRPVCANCHAMIHRRTPPFSIDEVKEMLQMI